MSTKLNISVLVAARDEYIEQLHSILTPLIVQGFNSIYKDALERSKGKRTIYAFQEFLKKIPTWNQTILQTESKRIKQKCPYIMDIVTAIFVSNVKILASIRMHGKNDNIKVKIPTSDIFIHSIYIEAAQQFFYDPFLFHHKINSIGQLQHNKKVINDTIKYCICESVRRMLPIDAILQEYLVNALNDNAENVSESDSDSGSESGESDCEGQLEGKNIVNDSDIDSGSEYSDEDEVRNIGIPQNESGGGVSQFIKTGESDDDSEDEGDNSFGYGATQSNPQYPTPTPPPVQAVNSLFPQPVSPITAAPQPPPPPQQHQPQPQPQYQNPPPQNSFFNSQQPSAQPVQQQQLPTSFF